MTDADTIRCERCGEQVRLKRAEYSKHLLVGCHCETVDIRVSNATPGVWVSDD